MSEPIDTNDIEETFLALPFDIIEAELGRRSFHYFFEHFAWPVLQPATPFVDNWHIHAICEHCEALVTGEIRKLLVNMPFRMLKSSIISHALPAWVWIDYPSKQFLSASYAMEVATRDSVDSRRIIESPKYQAAYGQSFKLTSDQNVKSRYENDKRGMRIATATGAAGTGFGGDIRLIDDPVSAKEADSALALASSIEWWRGTMATRANDPEKVATVIVHQRLNPNDLTGYCLANEDDWVHLVLPFRYDPQRTKTTVLGFKDPRTKEGELIHPARLGEKAAKELENTIGGYHKSAQLQQNPEPRGGIIFERSKWNFWKVLPKMDEIALSVDCTFKDLQSSDYVAIQVWGSAGANRYLIRRLKARLNFKATCDTVRSTKAMFPEAIATLIEDKANGSAVIETLTAEIGGIIAINPEGGKVARAYAMQPEQEAGNIYLPDPSIDPDIETFLTEVSSFPASPNDDEVDAMSQYCNWARVRVKSRGFIDWMKAEVQERNTQLNRLPV